VFQFHQLTPAAILGCRVEYARGGRAMLRRSYFSRRDRRGMMRRGCFIAMNARSGIINKVV
jgi:hypothetical protein